MEDIENPGAGDNSANAGADIAAKTQAELAEFRQQFNQFMASQAKPAAPVEAPKPRINEAELKELMEKNPNEAMLKMFSEFGNMAAEKATKHVDQVMLREKFDAQAERDFSGIFQDKEGQKVVAKKANELVSNGEYSKDSPMLLLRAAQLAANEFRPAKKTDSPDYDSGEPPSSRERGRARDTVPRGYAEMARMFGMDEKKTKEILQKKGIVK